jgi:hypothetical protein
LKIKKYKEGEMKTAEVIFTWILIIVCCFLTWLVTFIVVSPKVDQEFQRYKIVSDLKMECEDKGDCLNGTCEHDFGLRWESKIVKVYHETVPNTTYITGTVDLDLESDASENKEFKLYKEVLQHKIYKLMENKNVTNNN